MKIAIALTILSFIHHVEERRVELVVALSSASWGRSKRRTQLACKLIREIARRWRRERFAQGMLQLKRGRRVSSDDSRQLAIERAGCWKPGVRLLQLRDLLHHQFLKVLYGGLQRADFVLSGGRLAVLTEKLHLLPILWHQTLSLHLLDRRSCLLKCFVGFRFEASDFRIHDRGADQGDRAYRDRCLLYDFLKIEIAHPFSSKWLFC